MELDGISTKAQGPTLSLSLGQSQMLVLAGPQGSGKTKMLRTLAGLIRPGQGRFMVNGEIHMVGQEGFSRRATPQSLTKRSTSKIQNAASALTALGLWQHRLTPLPQLSETLRQRCELLGCLATSASFLLIDEHLDPLDPWTLPPVWDLLDEKRRQGASLVVASSRPDTMAKADLIVLLENQEPRFAGSLPDLLRSAKESQIEVITVRQEGVRALVEPFEVSVRETETGLVFSAAEGQQLAARLILEGYGDVKMVVYRPPKLEAALVEITGPQNQGSASDPRG